MAYWVKSSLRACQKISSTQTKNQAKRLYTFILLLYIKRNSTLSCKQVLFVNTKWYTCVNPIIKYSHPPFMTLLFGGKIPCVTADVMERVVDCPKLFIASCVMRGAKLRVRNWIVHINVHVIPVTDLFTRSLCFSATYKCPLGYP